MMPDYRDVNPFQQLLAQSLQTCGVEVTFAKGYKRVLPVYRQVRQYTEIQILHLHWITPFLKGSNTLMVALYAIKFLCDLGLTRLTGTKIVWTIHNQVSHDTPFAGIEIIVRRITSRLVHAAILHGNSLMDLILDQYKIPPAKLSIINLGNYRDVYPALMDKTMAREKLSIPSGVKKVYLHQGLLKPYKGIEDLIQVWSERDTEIKDELLIIAGKASDLDYENALRASIKNNNSVRLIPRYVTDEEITILYSACDVVVLPFKRIMVSSSLMVAISFGKPVIAPKLGGCEELLDDAVDLLYDPKEGLEGLKKSMAKSHEINLAMLGARTNARADFYTWGDVAKKTRYVYDQTLSTK